MENHEITKKDDNTITVVKTMPIAFDFTVEYLKEQRQKIVEQQIRDNEQREKELAEVDAYLAECTKLDVVEKPVEVLTEDKEIK